MEKLTELRCKEVINLRNGERLGFVGDLRIECLSGKICDIIVPTGSPLPFFRQDEYVIPWSAIEKIGEDAILVDFDCPPRPRKKRR